MSKGYKKLSNPFSTGGGGEHFEAHVQASFVTLMLIGGFAPCLPRWPISKIKLQGKFEGYDIDDLIVFVEKPKSDFKCKLLGQIKHSINITENDKKFGEVIQAAWNDFNNTNLFSKSKDAIALITGLSNVKDLNDVRTILDWARHSENANEFINKVSLANFSSKIKQKKLQAFRTNIQNANGSNPISDEILFEFLKHFHVLVYDFDIQTGGYLSFIHSFIDQYSPDNALSLWTRIVDEVQYANENAGTISSDSLPEDLQSVFKQRIQSIPNEFSFIQLLPVKPDWNRNEYVSDLAIANLIGAWNAKSEGDMEILHQLIKEKYDIWIHRIREILQLPESPLSLQNGKWRVTDRKNLWKTLGTRLFDDDLDNLKKCVITILSEPDPQFELPPEERYAASIHGKVLQYSSELRRGLAEGLALLGNYPDALTNCSQNKSEITVVLAVREIFHEADWVLWGSLNNLLPLLAEAAPDEFLNAVETTLQKSPCPFDKLFLQEGRGLIGNNYFTGLLWALETLAWDEKFLVRACVILGELASHDPGGNWANRPSNSLTMIFLPWFPQTTASIDKRKTALQTLQKEVPTVAWKLLLSLLPNQSQISSGTHKPAWRNIIPDDWKSSVTQHEYWEQVSSYAELVVSMASNDMEKLNELVNHLNSLPKPFFDKVLELLSSETISSKPENERLTLWAGLMDLVSSHRRFKRNSSDEIISKTENVAIKLAPTNPLNLYSRLFNTRYLDFYEENEDWKKQQQKIEEHRNQAVKNIMAYGGIDAIIQFVEDVDLPSHVGYAFNVIVQPEIDTIIFPTLLETGNKKLMQFASGYASSRQHKYGWEWADKLDKSSWSTVQIGNFLTYMPFTQETWKRVTEWLGEFEKEYWNRTDANPYHTSGDIGYAIDKLIEYKRPHAALNCLNWTLYDKQLLDEPRSVKALLAAVSSTEPAHAPDIHNIIKIIKALQDDPNTNPNDLFQIEWAYLPLLKDYDNASPKLLENKLASDPSFFCEAIRIIYRSEREDKSEKQPSERDKSIATNAWRLLHEWRTPPGTQPDDSFLRKEFINWLEQTKKLCAESGHLGVALTHIGQVLIHCPPDPEGLWIDKAVADKLNAKDAEKMRNGFRLGIINSRGVHWVDPTGKPERELAEQYIQKAEEVENAGYHRFAVTLREIAENYTREADLIVKEHKHESEAY